MQIPWGSDGINRALLGWMPMKPLAGMKPRVADTSQDSAVHDSHVPMAARGEYKFTVGAGVMLSSH